MAGLLDFGGGLLGNLGAAAQNFLHSPSTLGAIGDAITGLTTGQRTDPIGYMQQQQQQLFQGLVANGVPAQRAAVAVQSPDAFKAEMARLYPTYEWKEGAGTAGPFLPTTGAYKAAVVKPDVKALQAGEVPYVTQPQIMGQAPQGTPIQTSPLAPPQGAQGPMAVPGQSSGSLPLGPPMSLKQKNADIAAGQAQGKAEAALPNTLSSLDLALGTLGKIENHPGRNDWFASGASAMVPPIPGTEAFNYAQTVDQLKNQLFQLGANAMRGLGPLSNAEGRKITDALANIDRRQSPQRFQEALGNLRNVLTAARANAESIASGSGQYTSPVPKSSAPAESGWTQVTPNIRVRPK